MKKAKENYGYESTLPTRLRDTMGEKKVSPREIAEVCETTRQAVSAWMVGTSRPDVLSLPKIAKRLGVSTDYLLGASDYKSANKATLEMCKTLHLSDDTILLLEGDIRNTVGKRIASHCECDIANDIALDVGAVFDRLAKECIHDLSSATVFLLKKFFDAVDSATFNLYDFQGNFIADVSKNAVIVEGVSDKENYTLKKIDARDLVITSALHSLIAHLEKSKEREKI